MQSIYRLNFYLFFPVEMYVRDFFFLFMKHPRCAEVDVMVQVGGVYGWYGYFVGETDLSCHYITIPLKGDVCGKDVKDFPERFICVDFTGETDFIGENLFYRGTN